MPTPTVVLIAAVARNRVIGRANGLVWRHPDDQRHFREQTTGGAVVMGRRTWDSLPPRFRPLPGRRNVVLTRDPGWQAAGAERAASLDEALRLLRGHERVHVIGGAEVYAQALARADELDLTEIDEALEGDACFPEFDRGAFDVVERRPQAGFSFVRYARRPSRSGD